MVSKIHKKREIALDPTLGKAPDRILAQKYNVSISLIHNIRKKHGIKPYRKHLSNNHKRKISLTDLKTKILPILGKHMDTYIAKLFSVTRERIRQIRNKYSIPKFKRGQI